MHKSVGETMGDLAFLSIRVPEDVRNRVKAVAAQRGERLQDLMGALIARFLEEAERRPPELGEVLRRLRARETALRALGVVALYVFGSVVRGDARPDSDVDLAIDFAPGARSSLFDLMRIKEEMEAAVGYLVDVGERSVLTRHAAFPIERELVRVF